MAVLEREAALDDLGAALADARAGSGRVVLLAGEAGIGKTTVLRTWTRALAGSVRVLAGACDDLVTARPFGPLHDIAPVAGDPLRAALRGDDAGAVHDAVLDELTHATTVLTVEDVHWSDEATLDVLAVAAARIERLPALLVLTYRDDEVDPGSRLRRLLGGLPVHATRRPPLPALSVAAVGALAGEGGDGGLRLHASTRGNPFLVTELVAARGEGLPVSVRDAVLARVADLPEASQDLLALLAVVPGRAERALLDALRPGWPAAVEAPERRGIVELTGDAVAFRHELAREAVEVSLPTARRLVLDRAVLDVLLRRDPPDAARLLHHAARSGDVDAVLAHAPAAARAAAAAGAHRQALAFHEQLWPHADRLDPAERAAIAEEHAWELYCAHRVEDAVAMARHAVALRTAGDDRPATARALVGLSRHLYIRGDVADAVATLERAVAAATGNELVLARTHRGVLRVLADDEEAGLAELAEAAGLATARGEAGLLALGTVYRGLGRAFLGHDDGPDLVRAGIRAAVAAGHREHVARGYTSLVKALRQLGRDDEVAAVVAEGLERTRSGDFLSHGYSLEAFGLQLMVDDGRWDAAETGLRRLVEAVPEAGILARETLPPLGRLLARRGDGDAEAVLARAWELATRADSLPVLLSTGAALAEKAWLDGDGAREHTRIRALLARTDRPGLTGPRGDLLRQAQRCGLTVTPTAELWPRHALALAGDPLAAAAEWERRGCPYERSLELVASDAEEPMLAGLRILDDLGAAPAARLTRRRLQALGVRRIPRGPQPGTRAHPAGLTARQADVLALLAEGLTNAQIAERLVLSVRTVDHHVAAVLEKLGVASRGEAARLAAAPSGGDRNA